MKRLKGGLQLFWLEVCGSCFAGMLDVGAVGVAFIWSGHSEREPVVEKFFFALMQQGA